MSNKVPHCPECGSTDVWVWVEEQRKWCSSTQQWSAVHECAPEHRCGNCVAEFDDFDWREQ